MVVDFDPVAFRVFGWPIHWYGLTYVVAFILAAWLMRLQIKRQQGNWKADMMDDLLFFGALGAILGGRIGYVFFYNLDVFLANPLMIFRVDQGGMSFHGGLLGVLLGMWYFSRKYKRRFFEVMDFVAPLFPPGIFAVRMGNFINGELWGGPTNLPWGMVFPKSGTAIARHPSPLYEACLEGIVLFIILWWFSSRPRPMMAVSSMFALGYGCFRFMVEFIRQPDAHIGYLAWGWLTMGQVLSIPLIVVGALLLLYSYNNKMLHKT